ncbi:MAG TPA: PQQ-binding-like beta-propeller repeat protein [Acidobacteriota bacterium]|nr:PQQ-binding-like beta-propeller repeat protein [Acidobacteriota bacterium]
MKKLVLTLLFLIAWSPLAAQDSNGSEKWFEAARQGDVAELERLLDEGADINAVTRYNSTALHFAADKGHLEAVRFLLEKGADTNITDSFYQTTPLTWALSKGHDDIALLLIEKGAENVSMALTFGIRGGKKPLVEAALASGKLEPADIRGALASAEKAEKTEIAALLKEAVADLPPEEDAYSVRQEKLQSYTGRYAAADAGLVVEFKTGEGVLIAQVQGQPPLTLKPVAEDRFEGVEFAGIEIAFFGRGGMVEGFNLKQGSNEMTLRRSEESASSQPEEASEEGDEAEAAMAEDEDASETETVAPAGPAKPWPSFRGPRASGVADGQGAPLEWSVKDDKNVLWKTPVEGIANSSPVIWGSKVFVTTAVSSSGDSTFRTGLYGDVGSVDDLSVHTWKVLCLDLKSGQVLWEKVAAKGPPKGKRHFKSSQANPSPATDGRHLAVVFPSEGLFVYDLEGNLEWKKDLGVMDSGWFYDRSYQWGFASSPILYKDRVIVQVDIHDQSFVAAYRLSDGEELWRTNRDEIPTWSTPTISDLGGSDELITNGTTIRAYDPDSGKQLWSLGPNSEIIVGTPVVGDDLIYVTAGYPPVRPVYAVRPGAEGDLTLPEDTSSSDHVAWSYQRGGTYMPSPVYYRGLLYLTANNGRLTCYDGKTGERLYRARVSVGGSFSASPVAADGRLYFTAEDGTVTVAKAGSKYEELSVNDLGRTVMATPAISDGVMVFRAIGEVIAVGGGKDEQSGQ